MEAYRFQAVSICIQAGNVEAMVAESERRYSLKDHPVKDERD
jgi:hypothetical protein